jgi:hypothetical protein
LVKQKTAPVLQQGLFFVRDYAAVFLGTGVDSAWERKKTEASVSPLRQTQRHSIGRFLRTGNYGRCAVILYALLARILSFFIL